MTHDASLPSLPVAFPEGSSSLPGRDPYEVEGSREGGKEAVSDAFLPPSRREGCAEVWMGLRFWNGTPAVVVGSVVHVARRAAWVDANGELRRGFVVYNECGNDDCVRPEHLAVRKSKSHRRGG